MTAIARRISQFSKTEIDRAFSQARRLLKVPGIIILGAPAQQDIGRILVIASRKVGNAVVRNTIKRRLKAVFYEEKMYQIPTDLLCIIHKDILQYDFAALKALLIKATRQCQNS